MRRAAPSKPTLKKSRRDFFSNLLVQIGRLADAGEREVMASARDNEMLHRETFARFLAARGRSPSLVRPFWWMVGQALGRATAFFGRRALLAGDAAFERKAVREYTVLVAENALSEEEGEALKRFLQDEKRHLANWTRLLTARSPS